MKVFYVDPMGYGNLALYDTSLLENVKKISVDYFTSTNYDLELTGHKIHKVYSYSNKKGLSKIISYIRSQFFLYHKIKSLKPKIVHFQWIKIPKIDLFLLRSIKKKKTKIILTAHNVLPHDTGERYRTIYSKIYAEVDVIIVHANNTKEELEKDFFVDSSKIHVIPHGILGMESSSEIAIKKNKERFIHEFCLKEKVVFSILGTINEYKGVNETIAAYLSLDNTIASRVHLLIAGKVKMKFSKSVGDVNNISIIDRFLDNDEFLALLRLSDYIMLPYIKISQSGVLLTALNEKKKVIVSNKGGLSEPFQFGDIGYILDDVTNETLKKNFIKATKEVHKRPETSTWENIHQYYSWDDIGGKTEKLYDFL